MTPTAPSAPRGSLLPAAALGTLVLVLLALLPAARESRIRSRELAGAPLYSVLPRDAIPALDEPDLIPISEAADRADPDEPFLGVEVNGESRAYSTWLLERHEIVNDAVGGVPIVASW